MNVEKGFFLAFDGIDGCGKRKVSRMVFDALRASGEDVVYVPKISPPVATGYATFHLTRLKELLWQYEPSDPLMDLGESHWAHLIASWFHAVDFCSVQPARRKGSIVIADSWFYKYVARFNLKQGPGKDRISQVFGQITEPDHVILIDVDPSNAEWRVENPTPSEIGMLEKGSELTGTSFVAYQSRTRDQLLKLQDDRWSVIAATDGLSVSSVVEKSLAVVAGLTAMSAQKPMRAVEA